MGIFSALLGRTNTSNLSEALKEGAFLVDVRTPREFKTGSIKGAVNIPLDKVACSISKFSEKKNIIFFCRSGARSSQAKEILQVAGFTNVINGGSKDRVAASINRI